MVQKMRQEWDCLAFQPEDVNDFALYLSSLMQQLAQHDDGDIDEQNVVEKYLCIIPRSALRSPCQ
jgi:hypothetical protein